MVSVHTARRIHATRRQAKQLRHTKEGYKDIFHPDHRPATIGLFGFIAAFSLFSLQLALTPFLPNQSLRQPEQLPVFGWTAATTRPTIIRGIPERNGKASLPSPKPVVSMSKPETGCYYRQVQCVKAPCPPELVCPGYPKPPTEPVCGNQHCEIGEADRLDPGGCGLFADAACLGVPAEWHRGTCPQDCGPVKLPLPSPLPKGEGMNPGNPLSLLAYDLNQDGQTNQADVTLFKSLYQNNRSQSMQLRLDINQDGVANLNDLLALRRLVYTTQTAPTSSDPPRLSREQNGCRIGGCSSHLCYDPAEYGDEGPITTCEYSGQYACFENAVCSRVNDECQWQKTDELQACLGTTLSN